MRTPRSLFELNLLFINIERTTNEAFKVKFMLEMSDYYTNLLDHDAKERYRKKLYDKGLDVMFEDPFLGGNKELWSADPATWPPIEYGQMYMYFINSPGQFTYDTLKAYKSLEAYNYFMSGWVHEIWSRTYLNFIILKASVMRSQATTEKPHTSWVILEKDGTVDCAHCTCMAGLSEVCSHVAAILFKVEAGVRLQMTKVACTSQPCEWNQSFTKKVLPARVCDINFYNPKSKRGKENEPVPVKKAPLQIRDPTPILDILRRTNPKAAIFTIIEPKRPMNPARHRLPPLYKNFYVAETLNDDEYNAKCETVRNLTFTQQQADNVEKRTQGQSVNKTWFMYREGRITASNFKSTVKTSTTNPSKTVINSIMQYDQISPFIPAIKWGRDHEDVAAQEYLEFMQGRHTGFEMKEIGLCLNKEYPFAGASPDRAISCLCCGQGVVEIKCPFKFKDIHPCNVLDDNFCLKPHENCDICAPSLDKSHQYYFQVQGQMGLCNRKYSDFLVWTPKGFHVERIYLETDFFKDLMNHLKLFFDSVIVPEIISRKRDPALSVVKETARSIDSYCLCGKGEDGQMIACDSPGCKIEWYHFKCIGLKRAPKGKFICDECKPKKKNN